MSVSTGTKTFESLNIGNLKGSINQTNWQLSFSKIWGYESKEGRMLNQMIIKKWLGFNKILTFNFTLTKFGKRCKAGNIFTVIHP